MIEKISLRFGRSPSSEPENIFPAPVTIFVGPNNSGKSAILREIGHVCTHGELFEPSVMVEDFEFKSLSFDEAKKAAESILGKSIEDIENGKFGEGTFARIDAGGAYFGYGRGNIGSFPNMFVYPEDPLNNSQNRRNIAVQYLRGRTLFLGGKERILLVETREAFDLQTKSTDSFHILFKEKAKRYEVRRIINEAFGGFLVIDPTDLGRMRIRFSEVAPR